MFKGVIFDLDGVICFTDKYHYLAWKSIADELNLHFDEKLNDRLRGVSRYKSLEIILSANNLTLTEDEKLALTEKKNALYRALLANLTPNDVDKDLKNALSILKKRNILTAIGSSSRNARYIIEQIGLTDSFNAIVDGSEITNSKPDPEVFLLAAQKLGLKPSECIVLEDAEAGLEAAMRGGFKRAAVGKSAAGFPADYHISNAALILNIVNDNI